MTETIQIEDSVDITEEVATYTTKRLAELLLFLHSNNFEQIYFDGNNATIRCYRTRALTEHELNRIRKE